MCHWAVERVLKKEKAKNAAERERARLPPVIPSGRLSIGLSESSVSEPLCRVLFFQFSCEVSANFKSVSFFLVVSIPHAFTRTTQVPTRNQHTLCGIVSAQ